MTNMSAKMEEAYNQIVEKAKKASNAKSFGEWYKGSEAQFEEWIITRTEKIGGRRVRVMLKHAHERYDLACQGIVGVDAPWNTVRALEARGLIETVNEYGLSGYAVRLAK